MASRIALILTLVALPMCAPRDAWAWGREGHRVVARIAARNVSSAAKQKIAAILGSSAAGVEDALVAAATWPDEIDKAATGTETWHFVNVPIGAPFSLAGLCPSHNCIVDRIVEMQTRLRTNAKGFSLVTPPVPDRPMTSRELAFLVHFVGDIHQPLHASNDGDRGGNCVPLLNPLVHGDGSTTTELHAVWDVDEVSAVLGSLGGEQATAAALFKRFQNGTVVAQGTTADWARESFVLAKSAVYQALHLPVHTAAPGQCAAGIAKVDVTTAYVNSNVAAVERQLLRAGIRLSRVLNSACAGAGCKANP